MKEPSVMLAPTKQIPFDSPHIEYPLLGSPKLDGMRIKVMPDGLFSRTHKKQCDRLHLHFRRIVDAAKREDLVFDCELWSTQLAFNEIMTKKNLIRCQLYVFDMMTAAEWYGGTERPFMERFDEYTRWCNKLNWWRVKALDQTLIRNESELRELFGMCVDANLEGIVVRPAFSCYKHGRCTVNEGLMFKWKQWDTVDAKIVGYKLGTRMIEDAPRRQNPLGFLEYVSSQEFREQTDRISTMEVELESGIRFYAGWSQSTLLEWPKTHEEFTKKYLGKMVEVRYHYGSKDKPRTPAILRLRPDKDD